MVNLLVRMSGKYSPTYVTKRSSNTTERKPVKEHNFASVSMQAMNGVTMSPLLTCTALSSFELVTGMSRSCSKPSTALFSA